MSEAAAWLAVSTVFASLGRVFACVDEQFRIVHASPELDELLGPGSAAAAAGRPAEDILGSELFGASGTLRQALLAGERREGWHATLHGPDGRPHPVAVTVAPLHAMPGTVCAGSVIGIVVIRPSEGDHAHVSETPSLFGELVARSPAMIRIFTLIDDLSRSEPTMLLTGESGTGKELLARAIHRRSPRWKGPLVTVNCAALPADLLETELFGHVRGAFTGAVRDREGRVELASGGTLFLDEVGDIPLPLQVKLLRILQDHTYQVVGESQSRTADVRIIAATNVDLPRAVADGRFREDLYYRLRVVPIEVPPLRARCEDIEPLALHLLARIGAQHGRALRFSPGAIATLEQHAWPGNVRELENAIEYAVAICKGQTVLPDDLPDAIQHPRPLRSGTGSLPVMTARSPEAPDERHLREALEAHRWNRMATARALGISRVTLWRRMREAGLE